VRRLRLPLIALLLVVGLAVGGLAYAIFGETSSAAPAAASIEDWRWAPRADEPQERPAGDDAEERPAKRTRPAAPDPEPAETVEEPPPPPPEPPPLPEPSNDDATTRAEVLPNGVALPPLEAPPEVRAIIEAGNTIARSPYKWGGGHGKWQDNGYDCSGSVSYALAAAGLLDAPLASGPLMKWGRPGKGKWVTLYSNPGHVYMVVAGVRFDTSAASRGKTGSRFTNEMRETSGYAVRHWPGL
jgi:hypothetical protein